LYLNVCSEIISYGDNPMDEEEILRRIAWFLEQGCTMLASHHDCGAPLFRCKGKILCPVCSPEFGNAMNLQADEAESTDPTHDTASNEFHEKETPSSAKRVIDPMRESLLSQGARFQSPERESAIFSQDLKEPMVAIRLKIKVLLRNALQYKLKELSDDIRKEPDLSQLQAMLDCIEAILRILNILDEETVLGEET
jgi:UPF0148 protein